MIKGIVLVFTLLVSVYSSARIYTQEDMKNLILDALERKALESEWIKKPILVAYGLPKTFKADIVGAVDQANYDNLDLDNSIFAIQVSNGALDIYPIGDKALGKYSVMSKKDALSINADLNDYFTATGQKNSLLNDPYVEGFNGGTRVMVRGSDIGLPIDEEAILEQSWGDQTKRAGVDIWINTTELENSGQGKVNFVEVDHSNGYPNNYLPL
jgi:hypothetical protein